MQKRNLIKHFAFHLVSQQAFKIRLKNFLQHRTCLRLASVYVGKQFYKYWDRRTSQRTNSRMGWEKAIQEDWKRQQY